SHANDIMDSSFNPNGTLVASSSWDHTVQVRNGATGDLIHEFTEAEGKNWGLQFSPDGSLLACGSSDRTLRIWDVSSGQPVHSFPDFRGIVKASSFSENGRYLAGGASTGQLRTMNIWDVTTGRLIYELKVLTTWITSVSFSKDNRYLALGTEGGQVIIFDMTTGLEAQRWETDDRSPGNFIVTPDATQVISLDADGVLRVWDL
ncbi:WD40 repeat-like protein, partial [Sistotremastrum niveocremeum HHB9708]